MRAFTEHLKYKFDAIQVETHSIRALLVGVETTLPPKANTALQMLNTKQQLRVPVEGGKKLKSRG
jgi:hypothetical protein